MLFLEASLSLSLEARPVYLVTQLRRFEEEVEEEDPGLSELIVEDDGGRKKERNPVDSPGCIEENGKKIE